MSRRGVYEFKDACTVFFEIWVQWDQHIDRSSCMPDPDVFDQKVVTVWQANMFGIHKASLYK